MEKYRKNIYEQQFVRPYYAYYGKNTVSSLGSNDIRKMRLLFISFLQKNMKHINLPKIHVNQLLSTSFIFLSFLKKL